MTTTGITNDQLARVTVCIKTLGWNRDQTTRFLASGWQVERLSHLSVGQAEDAITSLVEEVAVWAIPDDDTPTAGEDADWAALPRVDRPDAPALPEHVAAIVERFAYLAWHPQHQANYLNKTWRVNAPSKLTIAQAAVALADLDARISLLPQGVAE